MPFIPNTSVTRTGAVWSNYTPTWSSDGGTQPVLGNGSISGRYMQSGKMVIAEAIVTMGNTTTFGTGNYLLSLPISGITGAIAFGGIGSVLFDSSAGANGMSWGWLNTDLTNMFCYAFKLGVATDTFGFLSATVPWTWAQNDVMRGMCLYEVA